MQIDKNLKNELLSLNDSTLKNIVNSVAKSAGLNLRDLNISDTDLNKIRTVIQNATDKDAEEAIKALGGKEKAQKLINELKGSDIL